MGNVGLLTAAFSLAFVPAPPPRPKANQPDIRKLQGEWVRVRHTVGGKEVKPAAATLVIAGDRLSYGGAPVAGQPAWTIQIDEKKTPKVFDREWVAPGSLLGECWRGVYSLQGDTLTVCSAVDWREDGRPQALIGKTPGHILEVFQRKKP